MTDITALAQRMRAAAEKAKHAGEAPVMNFCSRIDALNEFQLAACPANVLALVEALEKAQKSNDFLKGQLSELANFNPDWDKLEASYESWREIAAELLVAKNRIAELESRIVTVKLPTTRFWAGMIECYEKADVITAIREAGGEIYND
ncbi:hypothetical protein [Kluyvera sp. CRP]|uniref:hypothetical protein n=1 Tax=Kluyvera sp. CRP TaxID=2873269 RepID=UPI001CC1F123|nr:hypothetical protein [Kluyvera sp. CRP]UAK19661.1 hypothetical protein K7B04_20570 [Kluyvera sp. CRP]